MEAELISDSAAGRLENMQKVVDNSSRFMEHPKTHRCWADCRPRLEEHMSPEQKARQEASPSTSRAQYMDAMAKARKERLLATLAWLRKKLGNQALRTLVTRSKLEALWTEIATHLCTRLFAMRTNDAVRLHKNEEDKLGIVAKTALRAGLKARAANSRA